MLNAVTLLGIDQGFLRPYLKCFNFNETGPLRVAAVAADERIYAVKSSREAVTLSDVEHRTFQKGNP